MITDLEGVFMKSVNLIAQLKVTEDDDITNIINEGDYVTCYVGESEHYIGRITTIGLWHNTDTNDVIPAIAMNCKAPKTVYTANVILLPDIEEIHKMTEEEYIEVENLISKVREAKEKHI